MKKQLWCEHSEKISKYVIVDYQFEDNTKELKIQSWLCPECGVHGARTELVNSSSTEQQIEEISYRGV